MSGLPGDLMATMRLGEDKDIYYYGSKTLEKQVIATVQNTRFKQALPSLTGGSSTFIISPDEGVSDIILAVKLPAQGEGTGVGGGVVDYSGSALPKAWAYQLIKQCSVRYGSSSQYFFTGAQMFVQNLREASNPSSKNYIATLGGACLKSNGENAGAGDFRGDALYAYVVLNLPHSSSNASLEKPNPLPTEMMNQPIVITVEMNPIQSIFKGGSAVPVRLEDAYFQVRQIQAQDRGQLMRPTGMDSAYSYPLKAFYQNEIQVPLIATTSEQSVTLTGFRQGDVRSIFFWIEDTLDSNNPYNWLLPRDVKLLYNGSVYHDFTGTSSQIWDVLGCDIPSNFENAVLDLSGAWSTRDTLTNWVNLPFSQVYEQLSGTHLMVKGKEINNAVVNVSLKLPAYTGASNAGRFILHAVYAYNSILLMSGGGAEYIF
jgi:hypothetical protein